LQQERLLRSAGQLFCECPFNELKPRCSALQQELTTAETGLQTALAEKQRQLERALQLENELPRAEEVLRREEEKKQQDSLLLARLQTQTQSDRAEHTALAAELTFISGDEARKAVARLDQQVKELAAALELAQKQTETGNQAISGLGGRIDSLQKQLAAPHEPDSGALNARLRQLDGEKNTLAETERTLAFRFARNREALQNITDTGRELSEQEKRCSWVENLADTANGTLSGKEKITLETFIQMNFFERILGRANTRFMVMSGGQYELRRRVSAENNRSKSGLELNVLDHYNGSLRSVKTLSGGESFLASLSLALGLADEIQSAAGGIQLDTMFVDEGFGSLDEDTLDQAIKALLQLTESNRLVGIISHVSELKECIDKQIVVTKTRDGGSHAEILGE